MNRYGALLMRQWRRADPERFAAIPDPENFFAEKGRELEQEIDDAGDRAGRTGPPGRELSGEDGPALSARFNAESDLIREAMIPEPDETETPLPAEWRSLAWEDPADE